MLDLAIVIVYMIVVLVVGIVSGRNVGSFTEYSLGKKTFPTTVIVTTIFATVVGGGATMGTAERVFSSGFAYILVTLAPLFAGLFTAYWLVPKFHKFENCISVGDIMGMFYGKTGKLLSGIATLLLSICALAVQVAAMGFLMEYFTNTPYWVGTVIAMGVVILYSAYGGMRSVTITDVVEFAVLIVAIPTIFAISVEKIGGLQGILEAVPPGHLSFTPASGNVLRFYSLMIVFLFPYFDPVLIQRLLMGRDIAQVKTSLIIASWLQLPYRIMVAILGLVALILDPTSDSNLAFPNLVNTMLPVGIKGFAVAGLIAVIMSTADSYLHLCSVVLTNDVVKPIFEQRISKKSSLLIVRFATLIIGILSIAMALFVGNIVELIVLTYAFWFPGIYIPLVAGILGVRASTRTFLLSAVVGITTFFVWRQWLFPITNIDSLLPGTLMSLMAFAIFYVVEKRLLMREHQLYPANSSPVQSE